jgi:outer membrane lipoprotein-sorting protein
MRTYFRLTLAAIAFLLLTGAFTTEAKGQAILNEILNRMDKNYNALQTLQANVAMDKYNSQLDEHDIYDGKATYLFESKKKRRFVRIDWTKPVQESLAVVDKQYTLYRPRLGQVIVGNVDSAKNSGKSGGAFDFINMSKEELKANYSIRYIGQEGISGAVQTWHLELTPKNTKNYKVANIWVDGDGMVRQMKITENNGDTTTVVLSKLDKNSTINASVFTISYPKNTKVVKG